MESDGQLPPKEPIKKQNKKPNQPTENHTKQWADWQAPPKACLSFSLSSFLFFIPYNTDHRSATHVLVNTY